MGDPDRAFSVPTSVIPAEAGTKKYLKGLVLAAGLLVLVGAGCAKPQAQPTAPVSQAPAPATQEAKVPQDEPKVILRSFCLDGDWQAADWLKSDAREYMVSHMSNGYFDIFTREFDKEMQEKMDAGWRITNICGTNGPQYGTPGTAVYFSLGLPKQEPALKLQFSLPKGSKGTPAMLGYWKPSVIVGEGSDDPMNKILFSAPFSVDGVADIGTVTEMSHDLTLDRPGSVYAKSSGGEAGGGWNGLIRFDIKTGGLTMLKEDAFRNELEDAPDRP